MADDGNKYMADDGNKGRSSPFANMFGAIMERVSPIGDRKEGQDKPPKMASAPGFGSDVIKPKTGVVATDSQGALDKAPSAEVKPTDGKGGEPEKKGFLGLWGGRRRKRKSRKSKRRKSRKSKRRKTRRKSRRKKRGSGSIPEQETAEDCGNISSKIDEMTEAVMKLRNENKNVEAGELERELDELRNRKKWCDVHYKGGRKTRRKKKRKKKRKSRRRKSRRRRR